MATLLCVRGQKEREKGHMKPGISLLPYKRTCDEDKKAKCNAATAEV